MKTRFCLVTMIAVALLATGPGWAQGGQADPPVEEQGGATPGVKLAQTLTAVTGIAISPLLGVSAVGAWKYYTTPGAHRNALPWFASPFFWIPGLCIVALLTAKDLLLGAFPFVKKPFDILEVFENKISALVVAPAVIPMILGTLGAILPQGTGDLSFASGAAAVSAAGVDLGSLRDLVAALTLAVGGLVFAVVWLAGHTINLLILLSPFGIVDLALKLLRFAILALLVAASQISPYLGALVAVVLVYVALRMAGWSLRLMVLGTVYAWDLLTLAHESFDPRQGPVDGFLSRGLGRLRKRTYGRIEVGEDGALRFAYRPWFLLPRRTVDLPAGPYTLAKDILAPTLLCREQPGGNLVSVANLPPRYRSHEATVGEALGVSEVRCTPIERGLRAAAAWLRGVANSGPEENLGPSL